MKIILSRKGFDGQNGGIPSPILKTENGYKFGYLPIPFTEEYSGISMDNLNLLDDCSVSKFIDDITSNINNVKPKYKYDQSQGRYVHLDPDLEESRVIGRNGNWKAALGQVDAAQGVLDNHQIDVGDLFLFFGWYQFAKFENKSSYDKSKYPNGFHAIFGYMQIGEVFKMDTEQDFPSYIHYHPHYVFRNKTFFRDRNSTIYVQKDNFEIDGIKTNKKGAGLFPFNEKFILTKESERRRTIWQLPSFFHPENGVTITYNPSHRWTLQNDYATLQSASKGQEFVVCEDKFRKVKDWAVRLVLN